MSAEPAAETADPVTVIRGHVRAVQAELHKIEAEHGDRARGVPVVVGLCLGNLDVLADNVAQLREIIAQADRVSTPGRV